MSVHLVECNLAEHGAQILGILNDAIVNSTAIYDYEPRELSSMAGWFERKQRSSFPVWGAVDEQARLLGFATYGTFRAWAGFKYSVEHSVYVRPDARRTGAGTKLMRRLIDSAIEQQLHVIIGGIDAANAASIAFHERLGFVHAGTIEQAGFKFGRWLDLAFYQLRLPTPEHPRDG